MEAPKKLEGAISEITMPGAKSKEGEEGEKPKEKTNAILVTGAFHARELLSSQVPLFLCLKLLH